MHYNNTDNMASVPRTRPTRSISSQSHPRFNLLHTIDDEIKQTVKEFDKFFELHDQEKRKKTLDDDEIRREFEKAHKEMEEVFRMWGGIHSQYQKQFPHHGPHQQWPPVLHPPHSEQFLQNKGDEEITYVPNMDVPHAHTQTRSKIRRCCITYDVYRCETRASPL